MTVLTGDEHQLEASEEKLWSLHQRGRSIWGHPFPFLLAVNLKHPSPDVRATIRARWAQRGLGMTAAASSPASVASVPWKGLGPDTWKTVTTHPEDKDTLE